MHQPILFVKECLFTGTAILRRDKAAYPDSKLLVASAKKRDVEVDLASIPVLDGVKFDGKNISASSASPKNMDPSNKGVSNLTVHFIQAHDDGKKKRKVTSKEKPMGKFCAECEPEFESRLSSGEIISKEDLEKQKVVAELKASAEAAEAKQKEAEEAKKLAEEESAKLKAEKAHLEKVAEVETKAIAKWEAAKEEYGDDPEIRKAFLASMEKILLAESTESVVEGYEELRTLDKKKAEKKASKKGSRFNAFDDSKVGFGEIDDEAKTRSAAIMKERFNEDNLRSLMRGEGLNPHVAMRSAGKQEGGD
jgi:hypothetical protein